MDRVDVPSRIRERELAAIRVQAENGLRENALKSLDERGGAQELVRQQYTGRYPFELLQNADDAARNARSRGRAHFLLTDTALVVADTGSGFGEPQVEAICSLGRSSKGPGESIGHKGLGFKSVGEITDHPQVLSRLTSFQFHGDRVRASVGELLGPLPTQQKLPVYAFPFPVEPGDLGGDAAAVEELLEGDFTTVIRLPFRDGVVRKTVEDHLLANLQPRLLLFLPHVDHLALRGTRGDFRSEMFRDEDDGAEQVLLETDGVTEEWLVHRGAVAPDRAVLEPLGEAWLAVDEVRFATAVQLDEHGSPKVDVTYPLHVYFPTDERPGLKVAVHAEWILSMDRRQVADTPEAAPYNQVLTQAVVDHLRTQVAPDLLRRTSASAGAIEALVPALDPPLGEGAAAVRSRWVRALHGMAFLPTVDGALRTPKQVRLLPRTLPDPVAAHGVARLDGGSTLRPDVEPLPAVTQFLAAVPEHEEMTLGEFVSRLRHPTRANAEDYYAFLVSWREAAGPGLVKELKRAPSVLGLGDQLLTPETDTIFFPRERGDVVVLDDLPVPIALVPEVDRAPELLRELGVRSFEWRELIREFLVPILSDPEADGATRDRAMAGLRAYHRVRLQGNEDLGPVLGRVILPARTADDSVRGLRPAAATYFSEPWTGADQLETIYGPFGEPEFLDVAAPDDTDDRQRELDFYAMLGVAAHPRLDEAKPAEANGYLLPGARHPHRGQLFSEWLAQSDVAAAAACPQGHSQSQQLRRSYRLDRHEELVASRDPVRLIALWYQLARWWGSVYEPGMQALFHCVAVSHAGDRGRWAPSLFAHTLRSREWVPVDRGSAPDLVRPGDAWIEAAQTPRRIQQRIPRISEQMYLTRGGAGLAAALELTDAGRPRVADLLALLSSIADEAEVDGTSRETDIAARWVQRTLHDVLRDEPEPHPAPETVRLLASRDGETRFVAQPPYADDPLLRDTFQRQLFLLYADAGLTKLTRYLSLVRLDDAVHTSAQPYGEELGAVRAAVRRRVDQIAPYLLALVRSDNSSAESRVRSALRHLELVVCERLVLSYEYDGTEVTREDAVCYVAGRLERRGSRRVTVGTAYLELDPTTGEPHWFPLGRQLAQHLSVPSLGDAFTMLLTASPDDRDRMMADRQIQPSEVAEARQALHLTHEDEEELVNVLDKLIASVPGVNGGTDVAALGQTRPVAVARTDFEPPFSGDQQSTKASAARATPPPVQYAAVRIVDAVPGLAPSIQGSSRQGGARGGSGFSTAPTVQSDEERRRVGRRGEEVAYHAERARLEALGKNPDSVHWVSRTDELSPYDLTSVDGDDQLIYIEVKSTTSSDPTEPFYISHAELLEATHLRSRYYVYRVTDVDTPEPLVTRWADPLGLVKEGRGQLLLANARMTLTLDEEPASGTA